ncbi:MAG: DUF2851 family protein [Bacteroidota bacterium]
MSEAFLHYLWKYRLFTSALNTITGEEIEILSPGIHNHNAGPDFCDARLRIGDTVWAGNVEIHINSSDWQRHGHHNDPVYDSVILHVVYCHDATGNAGRMPVTVISEKFDKKIYNAYESFITTKNRVPCIRLVGTVDKNEISLWLERMLIERLEYKSEYIQEYLDISENDWFGVFYIMLARSFGFNLNALPFEMLARSLPYRIIARHKDNPMQIEALIFGQAGLLDQRHTEPWPLQLYAEYSFLRKKYKLIPIAPHLWRFMRLRPVNFPTIRLAQFASLLSSPENPLSALPECRSAKELSRLLNAMASDFWDTHYNFNKSSAFGKKKLGQASVNLLVINAVLPFLFVYGRATANDDLCNRSLTFYTQIPGEKNSITVNWKSAGLDTSTAFNTQALISMKSDYCDKFRCLDCRIGNLLLRNPETLSCSN